MLNNQQLDEYLAKLGLQRERPDRAFLDKLLARHIEQITFSALAVPLGRYYSLHINDIFKRLVQDGIGGYCYEQNGLLQAALEALDYRVIAVMAKVVFRFDDPFVDRALTHRSALVDFEGQWWLADAGFSQMSPGIALPLDGTEINGYRVIEARADDWHLQQKQALGWKTLFRFSLRVCSPLEIEMGHLWSSKHPSATFVNNVMVSRIFADKRIMLNNLNFQIWQEQQLLEDASINSLDEMQSLLTKEFNLYLNDVDLKRVFDKARHLSSSS